MKKLLPFLLLLSFLIPTFAFASAVTREMALVDQALNSTANTSFNDVRALNGTISGNVSQRAIAGGSAGTISQPISMPASAGAAARSAAGLAGRMAGGFAAAAAAGWAVQKLLDGVGYVMHEGAIVKKKTDSDVTTCKSDGSDCAYAQYLYLVNSTSVYYSSPDAAFSSVLQAWQSAHPTYVFTLVSSSSDGLTRSYHQEGCCTLVIALTKISNKNYSSTATQPSSYTSVTNQQVQDAFYNWMINNPTSVTDPVYQALYTPAQTTGWNLTGEEGAHYGNDGITDEMVNNILAARNAALTGSKTYTLNDSVIPNVDGTSTETTTNPDGSKKTTNTSVTTDKGKRTTTAIETTTNPDGTTSTKTTTKTEDLPQTYPAACEWFATACDWFGWTQKDDPITDDPQIDQSDLPTPTLSENAVSWGSQCPNPQLINFNLMGQTANIQLSWTPVCTLLSYLYYPILAGAYIAAAYIVIGAYKS